MKTVHLITIAYNLPDSTQLLLDTAVGSARSSGYDLFIHLFLHNSRPDVVAMCESLEKDYHDRIAYYAYGFNRGLSNSWNEGILEATKRNSDVILIVNDDASFNEGDIKKIADKALGEPDKYMVSVAGIHTGFNKRIPSHGYSCFALNPIAIEKVGMFDENIFPIYLEDCDHHRRATLLGLVETNCPDTLVIHGGSTSVRTDPELSRQNAVTHHKNGEYYQKKWGGMNEKEVYELPFNNPDFSLYIHPDNRHNPYGEGYDRTDWGIVKI